MNDEPTDSRAAKALEAIAEAMARAPRELEWTRDEVSWDFRNRKEHPPLQILLEWRRHMEEVIEENVGPASAAELPQGSARGPRTAPGNIAQLVQGLCEAVQALARALREYPNALFQRNDTERARQRTAKLPGARSTVRQMREAKDEPEGVAELKKRVDRFQAVATGLGIAATVLAGFGLKLRIDLNEALAKADEASQQVDDRVSAAQEELRVLEKDLAMSLRDQASALQAGAEENFKQFVGLVTGDVLSDWISFIPDADWIANSGFSGFWRRVGSDIEVVVRFTMSDTPVFSKFAWRDALPSAFDGFRPRPHAGLVGTAIAVGNGEVLVSSLIVENNVSQFHLSGYPALCVSSSMLARAVEGSEALANALDQADRRKPTYPRPWIITDSVQVTARFSLPVE